MRRVMVLLALGLAAAVSAGSLKEGKTRHQRIVGGSTTTIRDYPEMAALLYGFMGSDHRHSCGGTVLNNRAILTAAHCIEVGHTTSWFRVRLGSTNANSGGIVFNTARIISHCSYDHVTLDYDVGIIHVTTAISFSNTIRAGRIAGTNYMLGDNQVVWAAGWGATRENGQNTEQLRHVQIWTINQQICRSQYAPLNQTITDNMLCSGWLNVGGRDQCTGDSGGPLYHNGVVVGVCSFGNGCARPNFAGVNARVSRFTNWINDNR